MNIFTYFNMIIENMCGFPLADIDGVFEYFINVSNVGQILNPVMLVSSLIYMCVVWGLFQITCIYPFRLLKKLIKYPSRKACEQ